MQRVAFALFVFSASLFSAEWKPLFNGRDLDGWTNVNCAPSTWSVRDSIIVSTGIPTGVLRTLREYENFIVELEWKHIQPGGNAGFFVHSGALPVRGQPFTKAIEVQIIDRDHPEGIATRHGDVFSIQGATFVPDRPHPRGWMRCLPSEHRVRPVGEWNHYRVECRDGRVTLAVNGKEVSGGSKCNPAKGFLCLESEGSECHFRNLRIQELTPSREPALETPDLDFVSLYTGVDLTGWKTTGAGVWEAKDWILACKGGDVSLRTEKEYGDFAFIVDWRLKQPGASAISIGRGAGTQIPISSANTGWNRSRITLHGNHLSVVQNEKPLTTKAISQSGGKSAIELKPASIEFANLYIRDLSIAPFPAVLVAGSGTGSNNVPANEARLQGPFGADFDSAGNMYIVEMTGYRVLKVDTNGTLTVFAGTGEKGFSGDGAAASTAQFDGIHNLAVAPNGDIYLADTWNSRIRKIDARTTTVSTFGGTGKRGFGGDNGPAAKADFGNVYCGSLDPKAENMYVADLDNRRIRKIALKTDTVTTVAGNGQKGVPKNGAMAIESPLVDPRAVIANDAGEIFILERSGNCLRMVERGGTIRTVLGSGEKGNSGDGGDAIKATLNGPKHLCFDRDGCVLIADTENHVIRRFDPRSGRIERIAGSGKRGRGGIGGPAVELELNQPHGVYVDPLGVLYISDSTNDRVLRVQL